MKLTIPLPAVVLLLAILFTATAHSSDQTKADNATALDLGGSWVSGTAPDTSGWAIWDGTLSAAHSTGTLAASVNWGGIKIGSPSAGIPVSIGNSGYALTLSAVGGVGIDLSTATVGLAIANQLVLGANQSWNVTGGQSLTISGAIADGGYGYGLTKLGNGTLTLTASNSYSGGTTVSGGTLALSGSGALAVNAPLTINGGVLDLGSQNASNNLGNNNGVGFIAGGSLNGSGTLTIVSQTGGGYGFNVAGNNTAYVNENIVLKTGSTYNYQGLANVAAGSSLVINGKISAPTCGLWLAGGGTVTLTNTGNNFLNSNFWPTAGPVTTLITANFATLGSGKYMTLGQNPTQGPATFIYTGTAVTTTFTFSSGDLSPTVLNNGSGIVTFSASTFDPPYGSQSSATYQNLSLGGSGGMVISGVIADANPGLFFSNLVKIGSCTLTLSGSNSYSGATTVNGGTLQIGAGQTTGSIKPGGALINNATVAFNRSNTLTQGTDFPATISGSGGVVQSGSGSTILSGSNSYMGTTWVTKGTLSLTGSGSLANSAVIGIAGGATYNISAASAATVGAGTLGSGQTLAASGGTSSAILATASGHGLTLNSNSPLLFTAFTPAASGGVVPLTLSGSGSLTLGTNTPVTITVVNSGTALPVAGSPFKLISKGASGTVANVPGGPLTINGDGSNGTASLSIVNGELFLVLSGSSLYTITTLSSNQGSPVYGNSITFSALVKANGTPISGTSTTVTFFVDGIPAASSPVLGGSAACIVGNMPAGSHVVTAQFSGNAAYNSSFTTITQTVSPMPVVLTGTRSYDGTATAAAGILSITNIINGDTVTVASGSALVASVDVGSQSIVSANTLVLGGPQAGNYTTLGLSGSLTITQASTVLSLTSSNQPSGFQAPVTFTATVLVNGTTDTGATGIVTFTVNGTTLNTATLSGGIARSLTITNLQTGTSSIAAQYSGDANNLGNSGALSQIVLPPQTSNVTFSSTMTSMTFGTNGSIASVVRLDTGEQKSYNSKGWYIYHAQDKTSIALNHIVALNANQMKLWSDDGKYSITVAITGSGRYMKLALVHVSNNSQTGDIDSNWPGYSVAFGITTTRYSGQTNDGWTLNTVPLDPMVNLNVNWAWETANPMVYWPYVQYSQTSVNPQPMGAVAIFPSTSAALHDDILLDIWSGEPTTPRPNRANQPSWTRTDAAAWLDRFSRELPPTRMLMFCPNNLSELSQVADLMFAAGLNSLYLFMQYWQGTSPSIDGINTSVFPNGLADLLVYKQYCDQRGICLYFHANSGGVQMDDPDYGEMNPAGISPDISRNATGTLLNDISTASTSFDVQPDPDCQPFVAPPPWGEYLAYYPPYYPGFFSSFACINNDLFSSYAVQVISPTQWHISGLSRKVVNSQWVQSHPAGSRVDFLNVPYGYWFIPDSRSALLVTQAQRYATLMNQVHMGMVDYDSGEVHNDLGYWGLRRFSQSLVEALDHPVHAQGSGGYAPWGNFEYQFNKIQQHDGTLGFEIETSEIGGLAPLRLSDPSLMATNLDEDHWAFGCAAGYSPNFLIFGYHIGLDLNTIANHGQWSQAVSNLQVWQALQPCLSASQLTVLKTFASDFYVPAQTGTQWRVTPTRAMLREGCDSPWQLMTEWGPLSPHQFHKVGEALSPLNNPYAAQTPQIETLVLPSMSATNGQNRSLMPVSSSNIVHPATDTQPLSFSGGVLSLSATNSSASDQYFTASTGNQSYWNYSALGQGSVLNMSQSRGIAFTVTGDNSGAVLVFDIGNRDYAITLNFSGQRTVEIPNGEAELYRAKTGFGCAASGIIGTFNYSSVSQFQLFLGYIPAGKAANVQVSAIQAMQEDQAAGLVNPTLTLNGNSVTVSGSIPYNCYLTYSGGATAQVYDQNWHSVSSLPVTGSTLTAISGSNAFTVTAVASPNAWLATRVKVSGTPWVINQPAPSSTPFAAWTAANGLTAANNGFEADPDGDGIPNGLEWVLGANPLATSTSLLPQVSRDAVNLSLSFSRNVASESSTTLKAQWSTDLQTWNDVIIAAASSGPNARGVTVSVVQNVSLDDVTVTIPIANANNGRLFARLQVTSQ